MGDYYKIKKILLILIIVLTVLRILKTSNVFAAEDVNSSIQSGNYVVQTDNHYATLMELCRTWQDKYCVQLLRLIKNGNANIKSSIVTLYAHMINKSETMYLYVSSDANDYGIYYQIIPLSSITNSNITISGYTWQNSYNFNNIPFLQITRSSDAPLLYIGVDGITSTYSTSGSSRSMPVPCLGLLSSLWLEVFKQAGVISTNNYEDILSSIETTNEENYTQNYYTKQAVQNTYSYLTNDTIETITDTGITQPEISENIDLTDVFDSLETLLTNENYVSKDFTIQLPNGNQNTFSINPDLLETSLTRAGGQNIISIIHALWYIGLYGWYIFAYLGIFGKLLTGDWFHLVKSHSPVTSLVKMSVGSITGGKY